MKVAVANDITDRNLTWRGGEVTLLPERVTVDVGKGAVNMLRYDTVSLLDWKLRLSRNIWFVYKEEREERYI